VIAALGDVMTLPMVLLSAGWLALFGGLLFAYVALDLRDRLVRPGRHRHAPLTEAELDEFRTAVHASLQRRVTYPTPATGVVLQVTPGPAPAAPVAVAEPDDEPVAPFVPGIGRRLAPKTIPQGMRLEAPTTTCPTCVSGGLVAGGRCIVCGNDEVPEYRNGVHK